ncbi:hypothetical protein [Nocardia sp. SC052]|uniref:hypothetical protein n=1 Tax=Nocardia sichangensis TaxID=3385975 RepID=UPI0039A01C4E
MDTVAAETWTVERLLALTQQELALLFAALDSPDRGELDGEYVGHIPFLGLEEQAERTVRAMMCDERSELGFWLGKAFFPAPAGIGQGYNIWRKAGGQMVRHLQFGTHFGESRADQRAALVMTYGTFDNIAANIGLVDEVRRVTPGLYLGAGTIEQADGSIQIFGYFVLAGPNGAWVGVDDNDAEAR